MLINVIATALLRAFFAFAPAIGLLNREPKEFALRGDHYDEAVELMGALNSRGLILSWPPFVVVGLIARVAETQKTLIPVCVLVLLTIAASICILGIKIKSVYLRPVWVPPFIFAIATMLDVLFSVVFQDRLASLISK
jgi:hypothetical protein